MSERKSEAERERELEKRTKHAFDRSVQELDAATRSRLAQARKRALAEAAASRSWSWVLAPGPLVPAEPLRLACSPRCSSGRTIRARISASRSRRPTTSRSCSATRTSRCSTKDMEFYAWARGAPDFTPSPATMASVMGRVAAALRLSAASGGTRASAQEPAPELPKDAAPDLAFLEYLGSWQATTTSGW